MAETSTESRPVHVVKFRGGIADGVFRIALGHVPPGVVVHREAEGATQGYEYAGAEEQVEHRNVYHTFRPTTGEQ